MYNIPVVLFIFKRPEKSVQILKQIGRVKPRKLYIIADAGRNAEEQAEAERCRRMVEENIDWDCEVIKNYAEKNQGCFERIGLGALWVFEREECAVFLEDDNYPELSFFSYCQELLERYKTTEKVLWICGTNYLETYQPQENVDYMFTHHMLPCGWASWAHKFTRYYDAYFSNYNPASLREIRKKYANKKLFNRDRRNWEKELANKKRKGRYSSWDYQMCFSLRYHDLLGIAPRYNQIRNIGVDSASEHGGTSFENVMTQRFCGMGSHELCFPLKHPTEIKTDERFEALIDQIVLPPPKRIATVIREIASKCVRKLLCIPDHQTVKGFLGKYRANDTEE